MYVMYVCNVRMLRLYVEYVCMSVVCLRMYVSYGMCVCTVCMYLCLCNVCVCYACVC